MTDTNSNALLEFNEQTEEVLRVARILETRYKSESPAIDADGTGSDDDYDVFEIFSDVTELENETRTQLIKLISHYEEYVNDSLKNCAINFNYARNEFGLLFGIWTNIRKVYDIVKYAAVWEASQNEGQISLQEVNRQIKETLLQQVFKAHLPLFSDAIRKLSFDTKQYVAAHQQKQQQQWQQEYGTFFEPEQEIDQQAQQISEQFDYLLDFFRDTVDRVKNGALSVWRREQKKAMLGIGLTEDMAKDLNATKPAIALQNATLQFQRLAKVWIQIDRQLYSFCSSRLCLYAPIMQKSHGCVQHLLQSSLVVDWRYEELCQPHIVVREGRKEGVSIIVKILAAVDGFRKEEGQFSPLVNASKSNITATFVKPQNRLVALSEEIAVHLRDNLVDHRQRNNFIDRAGNITHVEKSTRGVLQTTPIVDPDDKTVSALFEDVIFALKDDKRRKGDKLRNACTRYHIDVTAELVINSSLAHMAPAITLKTLSTPFSYSVNIAQDKIQYRSFVWNLLGSHPDSVSCYCQPLNKDARDLTQVYWGDYREALKWLFYKLTHSRVLHDDELQHLGFRLFGNNDFSLSKTFGIQRGDPSCPGFSRIQISKSDKKPNEEKKEKYAPLFHWFFEAIELIIDRQEHLARPKEPSGGEPRLTMATLFQSGMILGFISRTGSEDLLKASDRNAMIIRLSDHFSGHITISYIIKKTEGNPEKIEHVRPLNRSLLVGMGLPVMVAMLINLTDVMHIITARLSNGKTSLTDEDYRCKQDLVKNHLDYFEGGKFSHTEEEKYAYVNRIMLQTQVYKERETKVAEETSPTQSPGASRQSSRTPTGSRNRHDNEYDALLQQFIHHPKVIQLIKELAAKTASPGGTVPFSASLSPSSSLPMGSPSTYAPSNWSPMPKSMGLMAPSPNCSQFSNSPISPSSSTTINRQNSYSSSQLPHMSMQSTNQTMGFQSPFGVQMMQPQHQQQMTMRTGQQQPMVMQNGQQQPMMMQTGQQQPIVMQTEPQTQWSMQAQTYENNMNPMQNCHSQQQLLIGMQQIGIGSQQQPQSFTSPMSQQYHQQQMVMQQIGHQQVANQHVAMNQNLQPQMMQQQPIQASFIQQPQQGMMQSSYPYQPQQQYHPQLQTQQLTFSPQQFSNTSASLQPRQTSSF